MHVSETGLPRGEKPQDHFKEGDAVRARILRIDDAEMKVGLSASNLEAIVEAEAAPASAPASEPEALPAPAAAEAAPVEAVAAAEPAEPEGEPVVKKKRTRKKPKDAASET